MILESVLSGSKMKLSRLSKGDYSSRNDKSLELTGGIEYIIYPLIGSAVIEVPSTSYCAWVGGRNHITEPPDSALYIKFGKNKELKITSQSESLDMIIVRTMYARKSQTDTPTFQVLECKTRDVGKGHYLRQVSDQMMPADTNLHIGETISWNDNLRGGCWSSWPAHASPEEATRSYMDHEEFFYVITPTVGVMHMDGAYQNGQTVSGMMMIQNNEFYKVPLGLHSVCFEPRNGECWGWYLWVYDSYLKKTYNTKAHHVGTYVK